LRAVTELIIAKILSGIPRGRCIHKQLGKTAPGFRIRRAETRAILVASIARGRRWLDELIVEPTASAERIAKREGCSTRKVNMTISLAFLAADLVGVARLCDMPVE
jgi:site-specific DNA recombinase